MSHTDTTLTLIEKGNNLTIATAVDYENAAAFLKGATALDRAIVAHYTPLKQAAHALHKQLTAAEQEQRRPVEMVIARVKGEMIAWSDRQRKIAEAEQAAAQKLADHVAKQQGVAAPQIQVTTHVPQVGGLSDRETWSAVVTDERLLPREYLMPDQVKLNAAARRMQANFNVLGARAVCDKNKIVKGV